MKVYSLKDAAGMLGVSYGRLYYALLLGVIHPMRSGRIRLLTQKDIDVLQDHFGNKANEPKKERISQ